MKNQNALTSGIVNPLAFAFEGHSIRTVERNGEPWFVAKDIAEALDYTWGGSRIQHIPEEWRGVTSVVTPYGTQEMAVLSEQGMYFFLGRSDKPKALPFQMWIAKDVVPSIRKAGSYQTTPHQTIEALASTKFALAKLFDVPVHLAQVEVVKQIRNETGTDLSAWLQIAPAQSDVHDEDTALEPKELAKRLGIKSGAELNRLLEQEGYQTKAPDGCDTDWLPTSQYRRHASKHQWKVGSKSGYNWKWNFSFVKHALAEYLGVAA